jgi:YbbR domain-containing protein
MIDRLAANWPAKVISVALALILVVFYRMNTSSTRSFSVPLQLIEPNSLKVINYSPKNIKVDFWSEEYIINSIADSDIEAYIDLSNYQFAGRYNVPVKTLKKGTARDVEPLEIKVNPLEVVVELGEVSSE